MSAQPYRLYIERRHAGRNMARYYAMSIETDLFGETCLVRRWGRIGRRGQEKAERFACEEEAVRMFLKTLRQKRLRGYRPPGDFSFH